MIDLVRSLIGVRTGTDGNEGKDGSREGRASAAASEADPPGPGDAVAAESRPEASPRAGQRLTGPDPDGGPETR